MTVEDPTLGGILGPAPKTAGDIGPKKIQTDVASRLERARAEIARRRALAINATPGPWRSWNDGHVGSAHPDARLGGLLRPTVPADDDHRQRLADAQYVAANDPAHVLAVLAAAEATLERHEECFGVCASCADPTPWPCPDAAAVLDLYAPR